MTKLKNVPSCKIVLTAIIAFSLLFTACNNNVDGVAELEQDAQASDNLLSSFRFSGYENMTVQEYHDRASQQLDDESVAALLDTEYERITAQLSNMRTTEGNLDDNDSFLLHVLIPLSKGGDDWKAGQLPGALAVPLQSGRGQIEFTAEYNILDESLTVGEFEDIYDEFTQELQRAIDGQQSDSLSNNEAMKHLLDAVVNGYYLDDNVSNKIDFSIALCVYEYEPSPGDNGDNNTVQNTNGDLNAAKLTLLQLKTDGYVDMTLQEYGDHVAWQMDTDMELYEQAAETVFNSPLPTKLNEDDLYYFITLPATISQNQADNMMEQYGQTLITTVTYRKSNSGIDGEQTFDISIEMPIEFQVGNMQTMTVAERDAQLIRAYEQLDIILMSATTSSNAEAIETDCRKVLADLSNSNITLQAHYCDVEIYLDEVQ